MSAEFPEDLRIYITKLQTHLVPPEPWQKTKTMSEKEGKGGNMSTVHQMRQLLQLNVTGYPSAPTIPLCLEYHPVAQTEVES